MGCLLRDTKYDDNNLYTFFFYRLVEIDGKLYPVVRGQEPNQYMFKFFKKFF